MVALPWKKVAQVAVDAVTPDRSRDEVQALRDELKAERERYHELVREILAFKRDGFVSHTPRPAPVTVPPTPDPESRLLDAHAEAFVANAQAAFERDGLSPRDAKVKAEALRDHVTAYDSGVPLTGG